MPESWKSATERPQAPRHGRLRMPAIGMEAEFNVFLDGAEIVPEAYWKHPSAFIAEPMLTRERTSSQLPTGGAVYFDRGVIEVVTPVIEIAQGCTARVVRNLWEQIGFVRDSLTDWERRTGHHVRLKAYSSHYNVSFELRRKDQARGRNIHSLALLLAHLLPVPVALVGCNRRSTGVGVRPRGNRIEITVDFTPDPGLMIATATLIVGIVRDVISWPSYDLDQLRVRRLPTIAGVIPGKHTTRKGWLTKDFHFPQSPFTCEVDAPIWETAGGRKMSLRAIAKKVAWSFRKSIRAHSDPFSFRLLFAILDGRAPSMLELLDRPSAYDDVGRLCRWGMVIRELESYRREMDILPIGQALFMTKSFDEFTGERERERSRELAALSDAPHRRRSSELRKRDAKATRDAVFPDGVTFDPIMAGGLPGAGQSLLPAFAGRLPAAKAKRRRKEEPPGRVKARQGSEYLDRREKKNGKPVGGERRKKERRKQEYATPFPDRRLTRSAYELVFLKLVSGNRLRIGRETYKPVGMRGWYHAVFRRESDGREKLLTIDQLLRRMNHWES
jgi:hypothetical protein